MWLLYTFDMILITISYFMTNLRNTLNSLDYLGPTA